MNTITFEVPRIKETDVDLLLDLIQDIAEDIPELEAFKAEKYRFNNKTTLYNIYYWIEEI